MLNTFSKGLARCSGSNWVFFPDPNWLCAPGANTAEIEESKKKIRQFENREKIIKQKLSVEERKARNHRLCKRGGFMESLVPELIAMPDEDAKAFLRLALTSEPAQEFLKKRAEDGNAE